MRSGDRLLIAHAEKGGKTEQLCKDALAYRKPVFTLIPPDNGHPVELGVVPSQPKIPNQLPQDSIDERDKVGLRSHRYCILGVQLLGVKSPLHRVCGALPCLVCFPRLRCFFPRNWGKFHSLFMIPELITQPGSPWPVLSPGIHPADLTSIENRFASNKWRRDLFSGLVEASKSLAYAGCQHLYLDGSFVTGKPKPGDYDVCWAPHGVDHQLLDPVFKDFSDNRNAQKAKYGGEFFPSSDKADSVGRTFLEFFQLDRFSGEQKGIILVNLARDPIILYP